MTDSAIPSSSELLAMRDGVVAQIQFARQYTLGLLNAVPDELWSVIPAGGSSNFAWQVGHLAVAQYGLMLFRQRGRADGDMDLMPGWLRKKFGKGTVPPTEANEVPLKSELMECLSKIHTECLNYVPTIAAEVLAEPTEMPFATYPIKLGALLFCPLHEMVHAGQIGMLRRLHGLDPIR